MRLPRPTFPALALTLVAALASCGSDDDPTDPGDDDVVTVTLSGIAFSPDDVTIDAGTTVRWVNNQGTHTVTPDGHSAWTSWSTSAVGQSFEQTFNTPGTYAYFCQPHQSLGMTGVVEVQ